MREIERKTVKSEKLRKEKSLENVVFSRLFMAEGVRFELTCPKDKRFSRPPRYDRFDNPPYMNCFRRFHRIFNFFRNIFRNAIFDCFRSARKVSVYKAFWPFCVCIARKFSSPSHQDTFAFPFSSLYSILISKKQISITVFRSKVTHSNSK